MELVSEQRHPAGAQGLGRRLGGEEEQEPPALRINTMAKS